MAGPIRLFTIGQRGVDLADKPQDIDESELVTAQNVEVSPKGGGGALDQRPGMTRIGNSALSGAIAMALDIPSQLLTDLTPYLYAGIYSGGTHNWRKSSDGTAWTNDDTAVKPFSTNSNIALYAKNFPKACTINNKLYFVTGDSPIQLHSYDGTTDTTLTTIPPAVSGVTLNTPNAPPVGNSPGGGATTYSYKYVATAGAAHGAASASGSVLDGTASLDSTHFNDFQVNPPSPPIAGATAYDVYRTAGGATQGKIGTIPISAGAFTKNNGSGLDPVTVFTDGGLVGDASTAPSSASGATAADALGVLDMITDGNALYLCVLDMASSDPTVYGRVLAYYPLTNVWSQIGAGFPTSNGNGSADALALFDGAFTYGTYIGTTTGNTSYLTGLGTPLPTGGLNEIHTTAASLSTVSLAVFNGALFAGYTSLVAATAAIVAKRVAGGTWSTSLTAGATAAKNAYTTLYVYNGRLYAGWTSGGGATAANIYSTPDGITWTLEKTLAATDVPCQMATLGSNLYVVCGKTGVGYNTTSSIYQRTPGGTWTQVDDPSDDYAGCLSLVYK